MSLGGVAPVTKYGNCSVPLQIVMTTTLLPFAEFATTHGGECAVCMSKNNTRIWTPGNIVACPFLVQVFVGKGVPFLQRTTQ